MIEYLLEYNLLEGRNHVYFIQCYGTWHIAEVNKY